MATSEERLATLEEQYKHLQRDVMRSEAHLENQDKVLDKIANDVGNLLLSRKFIDRLANWALALIAATLGYWAHKHLP